VIAAIHNLVSYFRFADLIDILVITAFFYLILTWIRQRASRSVVIAIGLVVLLYILAKLFNLYLTSFLFQAGLTAALVALGWVNVIGFLIGLSSPVASALGAALRWKALLSRDYDRSHGEEG
jgi:DNA integrity scanning protein DisA with diadenylate cyclase activity